MLLDKFEELGEARRALAASGSMPFGAVVEQVHSATEGVVLGRDVILAGTNNYLGLTFHPDCLASARQALEDWGTGTTGSRLANGTFADHLALESDLAAFFGVDHAIVFTTGYAATQGLCSTLAGPGDVIMMDGDCHASIYAGVQLSGADIIRFRHNDMTDLDKRLRRLGDRAANTLVVTEGIFSMGGDIAPIAEIVALKKKHGCFLLVDEAHSMGVMGATGRGACQAAGVEADVDFIVGTFSKSLGATGGYCVSHHAALEDIRCAVRTYIFTASPVPSVVGSVRAALKVVAGNPQLRDSLWRNARRLHDALGAHGFRVGPQVSPVVAVAMEDDHQALAYWRTLLDAGVYVNLVIPPASPDGGSLLRCSVSAAHTEEQIDGIIAAFCALEP